LEPLDFRIEIPAWVGNFLAHSPKVFAAAEDRMRFVIALARENVERQSGGPFGAAVFDAKGNLVAPGINVVVTSNCSILHAEMIALAMAQKKLGRYDIGNGGTSPYELVTSAEPCAMCFGAVPWSGVSRLVCGARDEDARRIGGKKPLKFWICTSAWAGQYIIRENVKIFRWGLRFRLFR